MSDETDFKFDDKLRQAIHYDWGKCYKRLGKNEIARKQFLDTLSLKENAHGPMEQLSKCYLERGDASTALEYADQCVKNHPKIKRGKYHRNECIYDSNDFDTCLVERYRMWHENNKALGALDSIKLTELTLETSLGHENGSFLNNFREAIYELDKITSEAIDNRPIWKIRREKGDCDVVSLCSVEESMETGASEMHPLSLCQLRRRNKICRQMYFLSPTTNTYEFLNSLTMDPRINFPPSEQSAKTIKNAIQEELAIFKKFEIMLQQRQPIYAKKAMRCKRNIRKFNNTTLLRMQETTEYQAVKQLQKLEKLKDANLSGLLTFVEDIMTNFYLIKTVRVFPKKMDFLNTIYNIVGIGYIDNIKTPPPSLPQNVNVLFQSAFSSNHRLIIPKKFNNEAGFKKPLDHFLKRLEYSDIPIEKCYIFHELSRLYFDDENYIESKKMGEEIVKISSSLLNYVWMLIGYLRVLLVDASLGELEKVKYNLEAAKKLKDHFKGPISEFLENVMTAVVEQINYGSASTVTTKKKTKK